MLDADTPPLVTGPLWPDAYATVWPDEVADCEAGQVADDFWESGL